MADLMKYLPDYYRDSKEMIYITDAENPEIDLLWDSLAKVRLNQFILDCDDNTLGKWERLLNLMPDYKLQSLAHRKNLVILKLSSLSPFTHRWLEEKLKNTFGAGNYGIEIYYDAYELMVSMYDKNNIFDEFTKYLRKIIPANLILSTKHLLPHEPTSASVTLSAHTVSRRHFITRPDGN